MCNCGKPSVDEAKSGQAEALTSDKNHVHEAHEAHGVTTDAACNSAPSAHDRHTTHAEATTHA